MYMPQLVQAMKYENDFLDFEQCHLERFLLRRVPRPFNTCCAPLSHSGDRAATQG